MHLTINYLKKLTVLCVGATLLLTHAGATFNSAFSYSYPIGEGSQYTRLEGTNSSGYQKANFIEYTPNSTVLPMISYSGESLYGSKSTISNAAAQLKNQGYNVIGGINADFFVMGTSIPIGLVIKDGTLVSSDAWQYAIGFMADGSAISGRPSSTMNITGPSGTVWISYFNKTRSRAGIYLLDSDYDSKTHISTAGKSIVLERVDDTPVQVGGKVKMKVVAKGSGSGSTTITKQQMVLTMDNKAQATWVDYPIGEEVELSVNTPDPRWANVEYAVGGKELITNGKITTSGIDGGSSRAPRTAVGVKDDGTVLLYEIDGRQVSHSVGLTAAELAAEMKNMGYNNAICLDGGGSSAMTVRYPGKDALEVVSKPSDGSLRACANYIFLVNNAVADGVAEHVHMRPSYYYMIPGAQTYFAVWGSDHSYSPATLPAEMTYTASSGSIDVAQQIYTAGEQTGSVTVTGTSIDNAVTGSHNFSITKDVGKIALQTSGSDVTSVSLRGGQSIDLDAKLYHQNALMASQDNLLTWTVSGDIGSISKDGVFTASQKPATGTVTCSYGAISSSVKVTVGLSDPPMVATVADFENGQPLSAASQLVTLTRVTKYDQVAKGNGALQIDLSNSDLQAVINTPRTSTQGLNTISLWMMDSDDATLTAVFEDSNGMEITAPLSPSSSSSGYKLMSAEIPKEAEALTNLRIQSSASQKSTLYLDHILMSQESVNNQDAPTISWTQIPSTVKQGATATASARISMNNGSYVMRPSNVVAYVDGTKSTAAYSAASGTISIVTPALAEGFHQITLEAIDDAGNRARKSLGITAGAGSSTIFADTASHWANGSINFSAKRGLLQGEKSGGVIKFYPQRNLKRSEFAVIMARYLNLDVTATNNLPFDDNEMIPKWAAGAANACFKAGIMNGQLDTKTGKSNFNPNANITRAEVMTVISKCLPRGYVDNQAVSFTDANTIPSWANSHVRYSVAAGVVGGYKDGTIRPLNSITRAEISKILCALY